jgi:hypothetical protein
MASGDLGINMLPADAFFELFRQQAIWAARRARDPEPPGYPQSATAEATAVKPRRHERKRRVVTPREPVGPRIRCRCGECKYCKENARWYGIFAKMTEHYRPDERGLFGSTLGRFPAYHRA